MKAGGKELGEDTLEPRWYMLVLHDSGGSQWGISPLDHLIILRMVLREGMRSCLNQIVLRHLLWNSKVMHL